MSNKKSLPYVVITETMDSIIANEIDRLEGSRDSAVAANVITDEEENQLNDFIEKLEEIRGIVNE